MLRGILFSKQMYTARMRSVDEERDEYVVDWHNGEKKDKKKSAAHIALHYNQI